MGFSSFLLGLFSLEQRSFKLCQYSNSGQIMNQSAIKHSGMIHIRKYKRQKLAVTF